MSGIFGALSLGGGEQSPADLGPMAAQLARRGPDGTRTWHEGNVALGQALLATTPEALIEQLPLTDPASGCTITADVRLDNRAELMAALGLERETRAVGDGELILRAYLRWGEDCPKHLLGDFAFAIWDPRARQLFCARDHMGMRQFIYHHDPGRHFVFATEAEAVLGYPAVPRRVNEARIADFLDDLEGIDLTSTFFEEIFRLPPAHALTVGAEGVAIRRYWQLQAPPPLELPSDEAYAEAFLEVFTEAVRCRLRSAGHVGSMLSGGMDSGSVAAVAARLLADENRGPLRTFSAVGPDPQECVETRTIHAAAALPGIAPAFVDYARLGDLRDALSDLPASGEPFDYHMTLIRAVYLAAHRQGIKVMLDGVAGDVALTSNSRVGQLLRKGQILAALREARAEASYWGPSWPAWRAFAYGAWAAWTPSGLRNLKTRFLAGLADRRIGRSGLASAEFARAVNLRARRQLYRAHAMHEHPFSVERRRQSILHPHLFAGRARYDRVAAPVAIEPRDPFMDIRLIEFCLSLPAEQLQSGGWPKLVLRRAMRATIPDRVIWRRGKEHLGWKFSQALFEQWPDWSGEIEREKHLLRRFVRPAVLSAGNQHQGKALDIEQGFKLFFLLSWLGRSG